MPTPIHDTPDASHNPVAAFWRASEPSRRLADVYSPPFALAPIRFPFPALAASIESAPLGGPREVRMATLQVARLIHASRMPGFGAQARSSRATATKSWLASMALPPQLLAAFTKLVLATGRNTPVPASDPNFVQVLTLLEPYLDAPARVEISHLAGVDPSIQRRAEPETSRPRSVSLRGAGSSLTDSDVGRSRQVERRAPEPAPSAR